MVAFYLRGSKANVFSIIIFQHIGNTNFRPPGKNLPDCPYKHKTTFDTYDCTIADHGFPNKKVWDRDLFILDDYLIT